MQDLSIVMETLIHFSLSKQVACRSHASGPDFITFWSKLGWRIVYAALHCLKAKTQTCAVSEIKQKISCSVNRTEVYHWGSRLCSLIGTSVPVTDLCMTKWATYFYSLSRCTSVPVFLHHPLISHHENQQHL